MNALLGVGQGSIRGSYLVTIEWNGTNSKKKPLALLGKAFVLIQEEFLKPAKFMEDMTYDMAGSGGCRVDEKFSIKKSKSKCSRCCWPC